MMGTLVVKRLKLAYLNNFLPFQLFPADGRFQEFRAEGLSIRSGFLYVITW